MLTEHECNTNCHLCASVLVHVIRANGFYLFASVNGSLMYRPQQEKSLSGHVWIASGTPSAFCHFKLSNFSLLLDRNQIIPVNFQCRNPGQTITLHWMFVIFEFKISLVKKVNGFIRGLRNIKLSLIHFIHHKPFYQPTYVVVVL